LIQQAAAAMLTKRYKRSRAKGIKGTNVKNSFLTPLISWCFF
jgi:hypothetical protein